MGDRLDREKGRETERTCPGRPGVQEKTWKTWPVMFAVRAKASLRRSRS